MSVCVVSWNIRKAVGLDWRRDPARILAGLRQMDADIALLQEADRRLAPRRPAIPPAMLAASGWTAVDTGPSTPSTGHHGNAILMRAPWRPGKVRAIDLPGLEPRGALCADLYGPTGALRIACVHLGLRRRDRLAQMAILKPVLADLGPRALLAGDVNEWRRGSAELPLPDGWRWHLPPPTYHASWPTLILDRVAVGPDLLVTQIGTVRTARTKVASDHLPVRAMVRPNRHSDTKIEFGNGSDRDFTRQEGGSRDAAPRRCF